MSNNKKKNTSKNKQGNKNYNQQTLEQNKTKTQNNRNYNKNKKKNYTDVSFQKQVKNNKIREEDLIGKTIAFELPKEKIIEEKKEIKELKKEAKTYKKIVLSLLAIIVVIIASVMGFVLLRNKFQDTTIEVGNKVTINDFLVSKIYKKKSSFVTNLNDIDFEKAGKHIIKLKYGKKEEEVTLNIKDTTPPVVEFQDVYEYTGYEIKAEDFIKEYKDHSAVKISYEEIDKVDNTKYHDYKIKIIVKDEYNNQTDKICILSLGWLKKSVTIKAGNKKFKEELVVNKEQDIKKIPDDILKKVDITKKGDYEISIMYDGEEYHSTVTVVDDEKPTLKVRTISIYENETVKKEQFISSAKDNSGVVKTSQETEIDYKVKGKQTIKIKAVDPSGNVTIKDATLIIKEDNKPPKITGLSNLKIKKNTKPNYDKDVKSIDNVDGNVSFNYDDSKVNYGKAGTYYVTYTSSDKKGNKATSKRIVEVLHDSADTTALLNKYADGLSSDITSMTNSVRKYIKYSYSWGDNDPIWYGLTQKRGNCFVHAKVLQAVLTRKGIANKLIWNKDKSHYWNLVHVNGVWRHVDSTPGNNYILLTGTEMATKPPVARGGGWEESSWPDTN